MHTILKKYVLLQRKTVRDVAQPGSALRSGRRGRKFESCHPDFVKTSLSFRLVFLYLCAHEKQHRNHGPRGLV